MPSIHFHAEEVDFNLENPDYTRHWINLIITQEGSSLEELNFIFCSDDFLHRMNFEYLDHDTLTDIITFDQSEQSKSIEGDIFISIDRVTDNAKDLNSTFQDELDRVIAHGVLHLLGFTDKTDAEQSLMRKKEEACLSLRP
ncbi:MAG: rRNA maturation RNase YbeY [Bacteroidota bacterium]